MVVIKHPRLSKSEALKIKARAKSKGLKIVNLANKLKMSDTKLYDIIAGRSGLNPDRAKRLYDALDNDTRISFLGEYAGISTGKKDETGEAAMVSKEDKISKLFASSWNNMYDRYSTILKESYISKDLELRCGILEDFQNLIIKYRDL